MGDVIKRMPGLVLLCLSKKDCSSLLINNVKLMSIGIIYSNVCISVVLSHTVGLRSFTFVCLHTQVYFCCIKKERKKRKINASQRLYHHILYVKLFFNVPTSYHIAEIHSDVYVRYVRSDIKIYEF